MFGSEVAKEALEKVEAVEGKLKDIAKEHRALINTLNNNRKKDIKAIGEFVGFKVRNKSNWLKPYTPVVKEAYAQPVEEPQTPLIQALEERIDSLSCMLHDFIDEMNTPKPRKKIKKRKKSRR